MKRADVEVVLVWGYMSLSVVLHRKCCPAADLHELCLVPHPTTQTQACILVGTSIKLTH